MCLHDLEELDHCSFNNLRDLLSCMLQDKATSWLCLNAFGCEKRSMLRMRFSVSSVVIVDLSLTTTQFKHSLLSHPQLLESSNGDEKCYLYTLY